MFTYLNPRIRKQLTEQGKLTCINRMGEPVTAPQSSGEQSSSIQLLGPIPLPLKVKDHHYQATWYAAVRSTEIGAVENLAAELIENGGQNLFAMLANPMAVNSVLIFGDIDQSKHPLVRVHSNCLTGDVFGSMRCECGPQLDLAIERIANDPSGGALVYMAGHEGRGIGLWAKAATYLLQDAGEDTYQANESLGLPADSRDFSDAASLILRFIGNRKFRLLTNNPKKVNDLTKFGLNQITMEKHVTGISDSNRNYLHAKKMRGHQIPDTDLDIEAQSREEPAS